MNKSIKTLSLINLILNIAGSVFGVVYILTSLLFLIIGFCQPRGAVEFTFLAYRYLFIFGETVPLQDSGFVGTCFLIGFLGIILAPVIVGSLTPMIMFSVRHYLAIKNANEEDEPNQMVHNIFVPGVINLASSNQLRGIIGLIASILSFPSLKKDDQSYIRNNRVKTASNICRTVDELSIWTTGGSILLSLITLVFSFIVFGNRMSYIIPNGFRDGRMVALFVINILLIIANIIGIIAHSILIALYVVSMKQSKKQLALFDSDEKAAIKYSMVHSLVVSLVSLFLSGISSYTFIFHLVKTFISSKALKEVK